MPFRGARELREVAELAARQAARNSGLSTSHSSTRTPFSQCSTRGPRTLMRPMLNSPRWQPEPPLGAYSP